MKASHRTLLRMYGLPAMDSIADLSEAIRLSKGLLYKMSKYSPKFYHVFQIPKESGGARTIAQPSRALKAVQAWVLRRILGPLKVSRACKGFEPGQNILENALPHFRANAILCLDIEDFFPSVKAPRVYRIFRMVGYNEAVAGLLTSLCTLNGSLPQGAPSSPKLANLACLRLDARLLGYAGKRGMIYTRYADDLTFSALNTRTLAGARWVIGQIICEEDFALNERKARVAGPARRRCVTGLVLSEAGVGIGRRRLREIRSKLHHLSRVPAGDVDDSSLKHVSGWLAFVRGVDEDRMAMLHRYIEKLRKAHPDSAIKKLKVPK